MKFNITIGELEDTLYEFSVFIEYIDLRWLSCSRILVKIQMCQGKNSRDLVLACRAVVDTAYNWLFDSNNNNNNSNNDNYK